MGQSNKRRLTLVVLAACLLATGLLAATVGAQSTPAKESDTDGSATTSDGTHTVRLRDLEDRINRLKEKIFRSKARLSVLAETVLERKIAGSKATIVYRNELSSTFRLVRATFLLDGGPIFNKTDDKGSLGEQDEIILFDGPVVPGEHTLSVVLQMRGHGYGVFKYLEGYEFTTKSSRTFTVTEGKWIKLEVLSYEKGTVTTPLEQRPDIRYKEDIFDVDEAIVGSTTVEPVSSEGSGGRK